MILDLQAYRQITKDRSSYDGDVSDALDRAQELAEDFCGRPFDQSERTENVRVLVNGKSYPAATPIASVSVPAGAIIEGSSVRMGGSDPFAQGWPGGYQTFAPYYSQVTYVGGWATGQAPMALIEAVARIAMNLLAVVGVTGLPNGVRSMSIGDVSISAAEDTGFQVAPTVDPVSACSLSRYRRPVVLG